MSSALNIVSKGVAFSLTSVLYTLSVSFQVLTSLEEGTPSPSTFSVLEIAWAPEIELFADPPDSKYLRIKTPGKKLRDAGFRARTLIQVAEAPWSGAEWAVAL